MQGCLVFVPSSLKAIKLAHMYLLKEHRITMFTEELIKISVLPYATREDYAAIYLSGVMRQRLSVCKRDSPKDRAKVRKPSSINRPQYI